VDKFDPVLSEQTNWMPSDNGLPIMLKNCSKLSKERHDAVRLGPLGPASGVLVAQRTRLVWRLRKSGRGCDEDNPVGRADAPMGDCTRSAAVVDASAESGSGPAAPQAQISAGVWNVEHVRCSDLLGTAADDPHGRCDVLLRIFGCQSWNTRHRRQQGRWQHAAPAAGLKARHAKTDPNLNNGEKTMHANLITRGAPTCLLAKALAAPAWAQDSK
jgi:hypothetical protein